MLGTEEAHLAALAAHAGIEVPSVTAPNHHHVILDGRRFHYVEWGARGRPPILFLHGGNQSARTWDLICLALSQRFHAIALDQRGHGDSEWSYEGDYAPESQAKDIERLADHLDWSWFVLVGMSMGCLNALHYAVEHCDRLAGLVAVDAGPFVETKAGFDIARFVQANTSHASFEAFVGAAAQFNTRRKPEFLRNSLHHTVREMADGTWTWRSDRRHKTDVARLVDIAQALAPRLPAITCPTLVVKGAESNVMTSENFERFVNALSRGRGVVIPDSGHAVQGDNPRGLLAALTPFFNSLDAPFRRGDARDGTDADAAITVPS
jgi:pimeloyl-ACP methyl ester carboxylesterase